MFHFLGETSTQVAVSSPEVISVLKKRRRLPWKRPVGVARVDGWFHCLCGTRIATLICEEFDPIHASSNGKY